MGSREPGNDSAPVPPNERGRLGGLDGSRVDVALTPLVGGAIIRAEAFADGASEVFHVKTHGTRAALVWMVVGTLVGGCARPREGTREARGPSGRGGFYHTVRRGETLSAIARRYGLTTRAVASDNALANPDHIEAGQRLLIRACGPEAREQRRGSVLSARTRATGRFEWPVRGRLVARYAQVVRGEELRGIVLRPPGEATVRAADAGRVVLAREAVRGYGGLVVLDHGNAWLSVYARLGTLLAREGELLAKGQALARTNGDVEFRLYRHGVSRDPLALLR